jgi:hypothetical protein
MSTRYLASYIPTAAAPAASTGSLAAVLAGVALVAQVVSTDAGSVESTLAGASLASSGSVGAQPSGGLASSLYGVSLSANGGLLDGGQISSSLSGANIAASGVVAQNASGAVASTLAGVSVVNSDSNSGNGVPVAGVASRPYKWRILRRNFTNNTSAGAQ